MSSQSTVILQRLLADPTRRRHLFRKKMYMVPTVKNKNYKRPRDGSENCMRAQANDLKVIVKAEVAAVVTLRLFGAGGLNRLLGAVHDTSLLVLADTLLEEVGLAAQRNVLHKVKGVGGLVDLLVSESDKQTIGNKLNVLLHQVGVHAQKSARESLSQELLLDSDGISDDVTDNLLAGAVLQVRVEQASKVSVQTLVTRDELVGEGQTRHETSLLEPEDGGKGSAEEDTLNSSKGNETLGKGRVLVLDPLDGPLGLLANARDSLNGVEEVGALAVLLDVGVDEQRVCLGVDVLHHDLETVEASSLGDLNLAAETLDQVLVDNAVRGSKEGQDVRDEVLLVIVQAVVPVVQILGQINLLGGPEGSLSLLVHLPDLIEQWLVNWYSHSHCMYACPIVGCHFTRRNASRVEVRGSLFFTYLMVLDGEQDESLRVLLQDGLVNLIRLDCGSHAGLGL